LGEIKRFAKRAIKELLIFDKTRPLVAEFCRRIEKAKSVNEVSRILYEVRQVL